MQMFVGIEDLIGASRSFLVKVDQPKQHVVFFFGIDNLFFLLISLLSRSNCQVFDTGII